MKYVSRMIGALALLSLMPLAPLWAQSKGIGAWRPVNDELGFFSAPAREQADQKVRAIKAEFDKDLFVETVKAPKRPKNIDEKDMAARNKFFDQFAEERFANLHVNGVYVMIIDKPAIIRIEVGNNTKSLGYFTEANRTALFEKLRDRMEKDKDGALLTGVNYVYDSMKSNHPVVNRKAAVAPAGHPKNEGGQMHTSGFNWSPIITIGLVIAGVWVLFAVVRALFRMAGGGGGVGAPGMGYGGGGGGGGGFFSNFLGGMFGAAAGMWMYNSFFGHGGSSAFGGGANDHGGVDKYTGADPADTSATSGGGDYGADGGGSWDAGDAGGGDAGGGDVGGGDWGGGGGDWGGGGGDFGGGGGDW